MNDLTARVQTALQRGSCIVLPNTSVLGSDRPLNRGKSICRGTEGDSDFEVGYPFDLAGILSIWPGAFQRAKISLNNIRIFGPISADACLHFHGYSKREIQSSSEKFHFLLMTVQVIAPYDARAGTVQLDENARKLDVNGQPGLVLLYEIDGVLKITPLKCGDTVVLPSGSPHTFAAAPGVFGSYGAIEICDDAGKMYQTHYESDEPDRRQLIAATIEKTMGFQPPPDVDLSLADIPGFKLYVERR
jgi:hypothetical protein